MNLNNNLEFYMKVAWLVILNPDKGNLATHKGKENRK